MTKQQTTFTMQYDTVARNTLQHVGLLYSYTTQPLPVFMCIYMYRPIVYIKDSKQQELYKDA